MNTDITVLNRRDLIKLTLDAATDVAHSLLFRVDLADLDVWMNLLAADHCMLRLRSDSVVEVDAWGMWRRQPVSVATKADVVRGVELPPAPEVPSVDNIKFKSLPVGELWRLESLSAVERAS